MLSFTDASERGDSCGHLASPTDRDKTLWGKEEAGVKPLSMLVMAFLQCPCHGSSGLCMQHVICWQVLVNRWGASMPLLRGVEEKQTPSDWLCMKPSACQGKKPRKRTCRVCLCYLSWRLKSSAGQGINHKLEACTLRCTEKLYQELMLISLPTLQTKNTNPCDFYLFIIYFYFLLKLQFLNYGSIMVHI